MTITNKRIRDFNFNARYSGLAAFCALLFLLLPLHGQAQNISQEDIQRIKQLSPDERERLAKQFGQQRLAKQFGQQQTGSGSSTAKQEAVDSTDDSVVQAVDSRERGKTTASTLTSEVQRYRDKASVPTEALEPFGYALFAGELSTFAPTTEIPIPSEYRIGPGDVVRLQLFGQQNELYELRVGRDGTLQMPKTGPISVAGLDFDEMRRQLNKLIAERFIGVEASITLGELRSIRIFVMGEARNPGAYTVSSLSNITNALYVSGGVKVSGSLRNVKLIRNGDVIATMDLYDLLLKGDTSSDQRLMPGDVIFIPVVGKTATIGGQVKRPAVYELATEKTIKQLLALAGGYRDEAYPRFTKLKRIGDSFERSVEDVDLSRSANLNKPLRNGDEVTIGAIDDLREGYLQVSGAVLRPGLHEWKPGLRVSDVLPSAKSSLKQSATTDYALIISDFNARRDIKALGFALNEAIARPGSEMDPLLNDRDRIIVFFQDDASADADKEKEDDSAESEQPKRDRADDGAGREQSKRDRADDGAGREQSKRDQEEKTREHLLRPYLEKLEKQVAPGQAPAIVSIGGQVRHPGRYPLTEAMTLRELVQAAGGLLDSTYLGQAEVARTSLKAEQSVTSVLETTVDLSGEGAEVFRLQARDSVLIKRLPAFGERLSITLEGEVRFPGTYTIRRGETLSSLIERAGGLTPHAYAKGAVFTRASLRKQEAERLLEVETRLRRDLAGLSLEESAQFKAAAEDGKVAEQLEGVLERVKSTKAVGRLVVDLPAIIAGKASYDVRLMDGDTLTVPENMQSVTVVGEIQFPTSHLYHSGLSVEDYLERSGGSTRNADEGRVYVIRADGSVWLPKRSRWFSGRGGSPEPGDTIVVPLDIDQINRLELASGLSQIIYQMALGAAAVRSF